MATDEHTTAMQISSSFAMHGPIEKLSSLVSSSISANFFTLSRRAAPATRHLRIRQEAPWLS
ncbi:MAG TPA: hypothetical protein VJV78_06050 [Polyangiales bacterium]|nr:hypothetical protein [Polyangiales bacterium]